MSVLITNYRGVDILFEPSTERFTYQFDIGGWSEKQSFAACKKSIDDFKKSNQKFEPFKVRNKMSGDVIIITGIRKDNRFVYDKGNSKEQISEYDEGVFIEYDKSHDSEYVKIKSLELEIDSIEKQIRSIHHSIKAKPLKELKNKYL